MQPYNIKLEGDQMQSGENIFNRPTQSPIVSSVLIDEPALVTLMRDLKSVGHKMRYVLLLLPKHKQQVTDELRNWDLWGPLIICLFFSITLSIVSYDNSIENFVNVFIIFWVGGFIVSVNTKLLGNKGSLFQSMSALGYCLLPLAILGTLVSSLHNLMWLWMKLLITLTALAWSTVSCMMVHSLLVPPQKKWLCNYPILLFYVFLAWYTVVV